MYMQLFVKNNNGWAQYSCDSFTEAQETLIRLKFPKFIKIEYYDSEGLIGIGYQVYKPFLGRYITYKKYIHPREKTLK